MRFIPAMKKRYDYGLLIFILTFCLVSISSYWEDEVLEMAHQRLTTIIIGSFISIIICICICPVWIGENLHNLAANNMEKLGNFLEGIYTSKTILELWIYATYPLYFIYFLHPLFCYFEHRYWLLTVANYLQDLGVNTSTYEKKATSLSHDLYYVCFDVK